MHLLLLLLIFWQVFEPVIGSGLKLSAEEIEMALIKPNSLLAKLHILLLKVSILITILERVIYFFGIIARKSWIYEMRV